MRSVARTASLLVGATAAIGIIVLGGRLAASEGVRGEGDPGQDPELAPIETEPVDDVTLLVDGSREARQASERLMRETLAELEGDEEE